MQPIKRSWLGVSILAALGVASGCSGGEKTKRQTPGTPAVVAASHAEPTPTAELAKAPDCDDLRTSLESWTGDGVANEGTAEQKAYAKQFATVFANSLISSCKQDSWPDETRRCFANAKRSDAADVCMSTLPEDSRERAAMAAAGAVQSLLGL